MKRLNKHVAIMQILILVIGIVAISYAIGSSIGTVSAAGKCASKSNDPAGMCDTFTNDCESLGGKCIPPAAGELWENGPQANPIDGKSGKIECCHCGSEKDACFFEDITVAQTDHPYCEEDSACSDGFKCNNENNRCEIKTDTKELKNENSDVWKSLKDKGGKALSTVTFIDSVGNTLTKINKGEGIIGKAFRAIFPKTSGNPSPGEGTPKTPTKTGEFTPFGNGWFSGVLVTFTTALAVSELYTLAFKIAGASSRNMRDLSTAAPIVAAGTTAVLVIAAHLAGFTAISVPLAAGSFWGAAGSMFAGGAMTGPGILVVTIAIIIAMTTYVLTSYKDYARDIYTYKVSAWQAPAGGEDCDKCNNLEYGCSEYQCKTFGQACDLVNKGTTEEACIWNDSKDFNPPLIKPLEGILPSEYSYEPVGGNINQGVKIAYTSTNNPKKCIPPYTSVLLGVQTEKVAQCKIDLNRTPSYDDMLTPMLEGLSFTKNHTLMIPSAATSSSEGLNATGITEIHNGDSQKFYIRCKSANGIPNPTEYLMKFCVQDGPDTQAPLILGTNYLSPSYLQYNHTTTPLEVYTNEPADCRWDFDDLDYDDLQFNMSHCSHDNTDFLNPNTFQYGCSGTLAGLKNYETNDVYIRCKDKPWWTDSMPGSRYANQKSYKLSLIGTKPLIIDSITVNGKETGATIKDNTNIIRPKIEVKTSAGAEEGKARCSYSYNGFGDNFYNDGNLGFVQTNTQRLSLPAGTYNISVSCSDAGGNTDSGYIEFTLEQDNSAPNVVRAYKDSNYLRIITDEPASCVYNNKPNIGCDYLFKDGMNMTNIVGDLTHYISWEANTKYYIKCKDEFGNRPAMQDECSIIVQAYEESSE